MADEKTENVQKMLDELSLIVFGRTRTGAISQAICTACGNPVIGFKNEISAKEYTLSGMCQKCQDSFFESEEEVSWRSYG